MEQLDLKTHVHVFEFQLC